MANEKSVYKIKARSEGMNINALRKSGLVPGVIYGGRIEGGQPIEIEHSELVSMFKSNTKSSVIDVDFDGDRGAVIVREVQREPATGRIIHVDLQAIRKDEVLALDVAVYYLGEEELASRRLILNTNLNTVHVKGPADKLPDSFTVDLTGKTPEDHVKVSSLELPEGVEMVTDPDELLVTISESKMSQDLEAIEEAEEEMAADEVPVVDETKEETEEGSEEE